MPQKIWVILKEMKKLLFAFLIFQESWTFCQDINRIQKSPYLSSIIPDSLFLVFDDHFNEDQIFTIQTLQGVLSKTKPKIYRDMGTGSSIWIEDLKNNYGVFVDETYSDDFLGLISKFKSDINGYVLYDENCKNKAISLCGLFNSIAIKVNYKNLLDSLNINYLDDARSYTNHSFHNNFKDHFSKKTLIYQNPEKSNFLGDYSIFSKAAYFFEPFHSQVSIDLFERMDDNSVVFGWGVDEYQTIRMGSNNSVITQPADYAANLSTLCNFNSVIKQKNHSSNTTIEENKHTVCFVMSDGDNLQWLLNWFITDSRWFGNTNRGKENIGWTINPSLSELAPTVMNKIYETAKHNSNAKDYFIAGPSGMGYIFADEYPQLSSYCSLLNDYMKKSDLKIVNLIGNDFNDLYFFPYLVQDNIEGLFYYDYANYSKHNGEISFLNNKPIITARYNLWGGFESTISLAEKINELPKDPNSKNGYSLIPVHNWSNSVDSILACINGFDENVRVVSPDEFLNLVKDNLLVEKSLISHPYPNPSKDIINIEFQGHRSQIQDIEVIDIKGKKIELDLEIETISFELNKIKLRFKSSAKGTYFITITTIDKQKHIASVIKE